MHFLSCLILMTCERLYRQMSMMSDRHESTELLAKHDFCRCGCQSWRRPSSSLNELRRRMSHLPKEHKDSWQQDRSLVDGIPERGGLDLQPIQEHACMQIHCHTLLLLGDECHTPLSHSYI